MREAIGGSWLFTIVMTFIVLFSSFLAISINYSRAFSVKNEILSLIERNEGFSTTGDSTTNCTDTSTQCQVQKYLRKASYNITDTITCPNIYDDAYGDPTSSQSGGYSIKKTCTSGGTYYTVTTFVRIELPIIWSAFNVPITGQTMNIYYDSSGDGYSGVGLPCS